MSKVFIATTIRPKAIVHLLISEPYHKRTPYIEYNIDAYTYNTTIVTWQQYPTQQ